MVLPKRAISEVGIITRKVEEGEVVELVLLVVPCSFVVIGVGRVS